MDEHDDELSDILNEDIPEWEDDKETDLNQSKGSTGGTSIDSILNENDDIGADLEADVSEINMDNLSPNMLDTLSISSADTASIVSRKAVIRKRVQKHGYLLKHGVLKGASGQIQSAKSKVDSGTASCLAIGKFLAIGTTRGFVFIFDMKQVLKFCLGNVQYGREFGAVSSLSFNRDSSRLLAGFAKGQMVMWDVSGSGEGKTLRTITDAHAPGTAVLFVRFTDDPTLALCADSSGSVFQLAFKRGISGRTCESVCLFTGSRGETCCIEPLNLPLGYSEDHFPVTAFSLVAMGSFTSLNLISLKPSVQLHYKHPLKGSSLTLPHLAWKFVTSGNRLDPILAFGRDDTVFLLKVTVRSETTLHFEITQTIKLNYKLLSVKWLSRCTLALLDIDESLHVVDAPSETELEMADLGRMQMCYNSSLFKSLATGGNVSQALAYAGDRACYHSVVVFESQLLILGQSAVHLYMLRTWEERLSVLMSSGQQEAALGLCEQLYTGEAQGVSGLPQGESQMKKAVVVRAVVLLEEFVRQLMGSPYPEPGDKSQQQDLMAIFSEAASAAIRLCITIDRIDTLMSVVYEGMSVLPMAQQAFLDALYPEIVEGRLPAVPPGVIKDMVERFHSLGRVSDIERCITRLDVASLDLDQVVKICWAHGLHKALFYIYNTAFLDYLTPLEKLTETLADILVKEKRRLTPEEEELGHTVFIYIRCSLAGESYLGGEINEKLLTDTQIMIFNYILKSSDLTGAPSPSRFPNLFTYLQLSTVDFLNMVTLAMEDTFFRGDEGLGRKQSLIDAIIAVMLQGNSFSPSQVAAFFVFLSRQLVRPENVCLTFDQSVFDQVLEFLCLGDSDEVGSSGEQQAIVDLLRSGRLQPSNSRERLLNMAKRAAFYQVCEYLYREGNDFAPIVECYLKDPLRKACIFDFVETTLSDPLISHSEKVKVQQACITQVKDLVSVCSERAVFLLMGPLEQNINTLINVVDKQCKGQDETLFLLLDAFFILRQSSLSSPNSCPIFALEELFESCLDHRIGERYIDLLAKHKPTSLYTFLVSNNEYRPAAALNIIRLHNLPRELAYILERMGDVDKANTILVKLFDSAWQTLLTSSTSGSVESLDEAMTALEAAAHSIIDLCKRGALIYHTDKQESLWFPLLDSMLMKQRHLKDPTLLALIKNLFQSLLNAMSPFISLPSILGRMLQDPAYSGEKFGEIQRLLLGMLETFNYETTLLETCRRLLYDDLRRHRLSYLDTALKGYGPRRYRCQICSRPFKGTLTDQLVVFKCRHGYHSSCLYESASYFTADGHLSYICPLCTSSQQPGTSQHTPGLALGASTSTQMQGDRQNCEIHNTEATEIGRRRYSQLHHDLKTTNRMDMLQELSKSRQRSPSKNPFDTGASAVQPSRFSDLLGEFRELKLAPAYP